MSNTDSVDFKDGGDPKSGKATNQSSENSPHKKYTAEEYFPALEKWLHDAYMWQNVVASFPYFLLYNHCANQVPPSAALSNAPFLSSPFSPNYYHQQVIRNDNIHNQDSAFEG